MNAETTPLPPAGAAAVAAPRADFPDWLPPMLVKELRQGLRAKGFVGLFITFHLIAILVFWWTLEINAASASRDTFNWLNGVFWVLLNVVLLLVVPLRGLGGLRAEIDNKTLDLLVLTRLSAWRIVLGKWVALVAQAALFLVALLPYGVVRYFFGSVDLVGDLRQGGWMFLISAGLSAVTLWVSGLPKIFRIILPILLILGFQSFGLAAAFTMGAGRGGAGGLGASFLSHSWLQYAVLALLLLVFLGLAVRRIAPPAENHSMTARLLGLFLLAGSFVGALFSGSTVAGQTMGFGFVTLLVIMAVEMSRDCLPMSSHWRPWGGRGRLRAWFGRLMLPGWPSVALFAAVTLGLTALPMLFASLWWPFGAVGPVFAWWLMLAWQALVFPAVVLSFLPATSSMRMGGSGYFVVQGLFGIVSLLSATNSAGFITGENFARALDALCQMLPVFSFWLGIDGLKKGFSTGSMAGQFAALVVLVVLAWRQSRIYWGTIARFDAKAADLPPGPQ